MLIIIDDGKQLPTTVLITITLTQTPIVNVQSVRPFLRFFDLDISIFLLKEKVRISVELEDIANTIFYDSKLVFDLDDSFNYLNRGISRRLRSLLRDCFPKITSEPEGLTYRILFRCWRNMH